MSKKLIGFIFIMLLTQAPLLTPYLLVQELLKFFIASISCSFAMSLLIIYFSKVDLGNLGQNIIEEVISIGRRFK